MPGLYNIGATRDPFLDFIKSLSGMQRTSRQQAAMAPKAAAPAARKASAPAPTYAGPAQSYAGSGTPQQFFNDMLPYAQQALNAYGLDLDPRWLISIAANETGYGKYSSGNNFFGIKALPGQQSFNSPTWEVVNGQKVNINDNFRDYNSPQASFMDFLNNVVNDSRGKYQAALKARNPWEFANILQQGGYATDPQWANKINSIYNTYGGR